MELMRWRPSLILIRLLCVLVQHGCNDCGVIDFFFFLMCPVCFLILYVQVEYMLVELDDKNEKVRIVLNGREILETLQEQGENINPK